MSKHQLFIGALDLSDVPCEMECVYGGYWNILIKHPYSDVYYPLMLFTGKEHIDSVKTVSIFLKTEDINLAFTARYAFTLGYPLFQVDFNDNVSSHLRLLIERPKK